MAIRYKESFSVRNDYSSTNVTTAAYVAISTNVGSIFHKLHIFDSSGSTLSLSFDGTNEVMKIPPGGTDLIDLKCASSTDGIYLKALDVNATSGQCVITGFKEEY